ncbi:MAG: hypothetical protein KDN22_00645 [Verrucomicrobiae bacterium]|nr:hypothetical protein [Verrucomicrobiae bacterium]
MQDDEEISLARLIHLAEAGQSERLVEMCAEHLAVFPASSLAHEFRARGLLELHRDKEAAVHVDILLQESPNELRYHQLAGLLQLRFRNLKAANKHISVAMAQAPDDSYNYYLQALADCRRGKLKLAKKALERGRQLDPEDQDIINLQVRLGGVMEKSIKDAWLRVRELEAALSRTPESINLLTSLGDIYLNQLFDPQKAEDVYRSALAIDPSDRASQRLLFRAVVHRSFVYRVLSIPGRAFEMIREFVSETSCLGALVLVVAIKLILAFAAWLICATLVFYPPAKFYEWLLVSEVRSAATNVAGLRLRALRDRYPIWLRWTLFLLTVVSGWYAVFWRLGVNIQSGFEVLTWFVGVHVAITGMLTGFRRIRSQIGKFRAERAEPRKK